MENKDYWFPAKTLGWGWGRLRNGRAGWFSSATLSGWPV